MRKAIGAIALHAGINVTSALLRSNPFLLHCTKKLKHSGFLLFEHPNVGFCLWSAKCLLLFY